MKKFYGILLGCLLQLSSNATTWETINYGFWNQTHVWQNNIVPSVTSSDTFIIHHAITIDHNLTFNSGGHLHVNSTGSICGHQKIVLNAGSKIVNYGIIKLDTLIISGALYTGYNPGKLFIGYNCHILNNGDLDLINSSMTVRRWYECGVTGELTDIVNLKDEQQTTILPIPSNNFVEINSKLNAQYASIQNIEGKIFSEIELANGYAKVDLYNIPNGMYVVKIMDQDHSLLGTSKILIQH